MPLRDPLDRAGDFVQLAGLALLRKP